MSGNIKIVLLSRKIKSRAGDIHQAVWHGAERGVGQIVRQDHLFNVFGEKNILTWLPVSRDFCPINMEISVTRASVSVLETTGLFCERKLFSKSF